MTHTPGPWIIKPVELGSNKDVGIVKVEDNGNLSLLAEVYEIVNQSGRRADVEANACLIVAAPAMLEVLEHDVIQLANLASMCDEKQTKEYMTSVYAAIEKAKKRKDYHE